MNAMHETGLLPENPTPKKKTRAPVVTWGGFVIAFVLLFNPMPMLFDILPDAIAYLLILFSLRRALGEIDVFDDLKKATSRLLVLSAVKIPVFFVMLNIWGGDTRQRSIVAVFCLSFSIMEFLFLRTWTHEFFDATARYGQRYDCDAALSAGNTGYRISPENLEKLTLAFFAVRSILSCLPEMALVPLTGDSLTREYDWNSLYPVAAILAGLIVLIFGIIWCLYISAYIKRISRDRDAALRMQNDIAPGSRAEHENDYRLIRIATYCLAAGVALQLDLFLDSINYLPDVLSALLFFAAGYTFSHLLGRRRSAYILPLIYAGLSLTYTIFHNRFYHAFDDAALAWRDDGALSAYIPVVVTSVLSGILLTLTSLSLFFTLRETVMRYTGITQGGLTKRRMDEQLRHTTPVEETTLRNAYGVMAERTRRELRIKLMVSAVLGCLVALITTAKDVLMLIAPAPVSGKGQELDFLSLFIYGWMDAAIWISVILWFGFTLHIGTRVRREAELNLIEE